MDKFSMFFLDLMYYLIAIVLLIGAILIPLHLLLNTYCIYAFFVSGIFFIGIGSIFWVFHRHLFPDSPLSLDTDCSMKTLRSREVQVKLSDTDAFDLCLDFIRQLDSKKIISSNREDGKICVLSPYYLIPSEYDDPQHCFTFEIEMFDPSISVIKYSSRMAGYIPQRYAETAGEMNREKIQKIGKFFEKYRVSYKEK